MTYAAKAVAFCLALAPAVVPVAASAETPRLLATVGMIADPAARIAGDCVAVEALIGPGLDPHLYQPRPSDIERLRQADRVVALGLGLEGRLGDVLARTGALILGDTLDPAWLLDDDGAPDPHLWMDPQLWSSLLPTLAGTLAEMAPDCAQDIDTRMAEEAARFEALDTWATESMASIPAGARVLLTAHDAFAYFSERYGLENLAIQGISTESEPSIAAIDSLARDAAERAIPAVFIETTLNPRAVRALIEAAAARGHTLALGGELYSDALGEPGSGADTYPGMIVANVITITEALGGTPAPLPEGLVPH
ncbi:MAG: zinc ABC transporter substrate-binding protein [Pararhodobacter sp.]|nr:zinc ABC transporter substrate-binding protein [Pararhodobacter sp.]